MSRDNFFRIAERFAQRAESAPASFLTDELLNSTFTAPDSRSVREFTPSFSTPDLEGGRILGDAFDMRRAVLDYQTAEVASSRPAITVPVDPVRPTRLDIRHDKYTSFFDETKFKKSILEDGFDMPHSSFEKWVRDYLDLEVTANQTGNRLEVKVSLRTKKGEELLSDSDTTELYLE